MKTWITYPAALLLGFSTNLLLGGWAPYEMTLDIVVPLIKQLGLFIVFPIVFVTFASAVASIRRFKEGGRLFFGSLVWGLISTLALSFVGVAVAMYLPQSTQALALSSSAVPSFSFFDFTTLKEMILSGNAFNQFTATTLTLLPLMFIAWLLGIVMKPDREMARPAYVVLQSFGEVMYRLARLFTAIGALFLLFLSADMCRNLPAMSALIEPSKLFFLALGGVVLAVILVILPLLFMILTLFRGGNPWRVLIGSYPSFIITAMTGSMLFGTTSLLAVAQQNNGAKKRAAGLSVPILTFLGRGGSALVATMTIIFIIQAMTGASVEVTHMVYIALFSALFSLLSSFSIGLEVPFIVVMVLQGIQMGAHPVVLATVVTLLPLLQMAALFLDAASISFGSVFTSRIVAMKERTPLSHMI